MPTLFHRNVEIGPVEVRNVSLEEPSRYTLFFVGFTPIIELDTGYRLDFEDGRSVALSFSGADVPVDAGQLLFARVERWPKHS
jgi:hypothetical protein